MELCNLQSHQSPHLPSLSLLPLYGYRGLKMASCDDCYIGVCELTNSDFRVHQNQQEPSL
jgi:hypothetical protein